MQQTKFIVAACLCLLVGLGMSTRNAVSETAELAFEEAEVVFEQNATDGDVEVVFRVIGGDEGLQHLTISGPDGGTVFDGTCPASGTMGLRQFELESPEPRDTAKLMAAFPEGRYSFSAVAVSGTRYTATAELQHHLPDVVEIQNPLEDAEDVPTDNLQIRWKPVRDVQGYVLELEQEGFESSLVVHLPASAHSFSVPSGFLRPGTETVLGIGTVAESGNASFVEIGFETAE